MHTTNIRCRHYDDQGQLISRYHDTQLCRFVHPDSISWETATRGRNHPKSDFATGSWHAEKPLVTSTNAIPAKQGGKTWGAQRSQSGGASMDGNGNTRRASGNVPEGAAETTNPTSGSSWYDAMGDDAFGWSATSGGNTWASRSSTWGTGTTDKKMGDHIGDSPMRSGAATKETCPWGSGESGWGSANVETGANTENTDTAGSGWNNSKGGQWNNGNEVQDVVMHRQPSYLLSPSQVLVTEGKKPDLTGLDPNIKSDQNRSAAFSPASPLRPLNGTSKVPSSRPKIMLPISTSNTVDDPGRLPPNDEDPLSALSPVSASFFQNYKGYKGRVSLFKDVILHIQEAIMYQIIYVHAQTEVARWKRAQASEIYTRPTNKARSILMSHQARFIENLGKAKRSRDHALQRLARLPDLGSNTYKLADPATTRETVLRYTTELKEWFEDLEIHKRVVLDKGGDAEPSSKSTSVTVENIPKGSTPIEDAHLRMLLENEAWTWKELKEALSLLQEAIDNGIELVYSETYIHPDFLCDPTTGLAERLAPVEISQPTNTLSDAAQDMASSVDAVGARIGSEAVSAAELITKIDNLQKKINELETERIRIDTFCDEAEKQFSEFDQRNQADDADIMELTEQVQQLFLYKRPTAHAPVLPTTIEDHLDRIRPFVVEHIKEDLTKIFENLLIRCKENQEQTGEEIDKMLQPLIVLTEQVRRFPRPGDAIQTDP